MSWRDSALSLCKTLGPNAKVAVTTTLAALLPQRSAVVLLVEHALACIQQTRKRTWKMRKGSLLEASASDQERLGKLFNLLAGPFLSLLQEVAELEPLAGDPTSLLEEARRADDLSTAVKRLDALAGRFTWNGLDERLLPVPGVVEQLTHLPVEQGLRFGCWSLWILDEGVGLLVSHAPTGTLVRVWLGCNGWFEYRNNHLVAGKIFTVWSAGNRSVDPPGRYLGSLDDSGPPRWRMPEGRFYAQQWIVEATATELSLEHPMTSRVLTFLRDQPVWGCNDVRWNEP
jgi:hypothetical protein